MISRLTVSGLGACLATACEKCVQSSAICAIWCNLYDLVRSRDNLTKDPSRPELSQIALKIRGVSQCVPHGFHSFPYQFHSSDAPFTHYSYAEFCRAFVVFGNGCDGKNRPSQGVRISEKTISSVDRVAKHKVYAHTNSSQLLTCHRWLTCAACRSLASAEDEEAHLIARADRAAGWRESRHQYGINHGSGLLQRQRAQQQPGQGLGWPSGRFANRRIYYELWTHVPPELERFKLFASDQDGDMTTTCGHVPVQSARSCDVGDGRKRYMRPVRLSGIARLKKSSHWTPYLGDRSAPRREP